MLTERAIWANGVQMASYTKLPSGRTRVQVRVVGHYQSRTFDTRREASAWATIIEAAAKQKASSGVTSLPAALTLAEAIESYLRAVNLKPANQTSLRAFGAAVGQISLRDLNAATLQRWIDTRLQTVTGATVAHNLGLVSGLLKWLRFTKHLDVDVELSRNARRSLSAARVQTTSQERDRCATDAELDRLRLAFEGQEKLRLPMADLMDFAVATAMRLGEIVRIEWCDFNDNARTIIIRDRKDPKRKLGNHMCVPLSTAAVEIMMRQPSAVARSGRVFPFGQNSVSAAWIVARKRAGVHDLTFHDLRHRAITDLFAKGLTIPQVALISGHKTWAQLRRYTQVQAVDIVGLLA